MALNVLDDRAVLVIANSYFKNRAETRLVLQHVLKILSDKRQTLGGLVPSINNGGNFSLEATQAAARTFPRVGSRLCNYNKSIRHRPAP